MPDQSQPGLNQVNPNAALVPNLIASQVQSDLALAQQAITLANGGHKLELLKLALQNKGLIEKEIDEVKTAIPIIKAGYKTTEFWLVSGFLVSNVFCILKGVQMPISGEASLGGLIAAFIASRHSQKTTAINVSK